MHSSMMHCIHGPFESPHGSRGAFYTVAITRMEANPMHIRWLVPILAACSLFTGCTKEYSDADLVFVTPDEGRALMAKQEATLFSDPVENIWVDPRRSEFYIAGHIPG